MDDPLRRPHIEAGGLLSTIRAGRWNGRKTSHRAKVTILATGATDIKKTYGESSTLFKPLIFDRDMTINFPHRLHLITSPTGSSRAVIRPQMQRTSFPEAGRPVLLMSISQVNKGHDPFITMTYEIDETSPAKLIPTSRRLAHTKQCLSAPNNVSE